MEENESCYVRGLSTSAIFLEISVISFIGSLQNHTFTSFFRHFFHDSTSLTEYQPSGSFACHTRVDTCINLDQDTMYEVIDLSIVPFYIE